MHLIDLDCLPAPRLSGEGKIGLETGSRSTTPAACPSMLPAYCRFDLPSAGIEQRWCSSVLLEWSVRCFVARPSKAFLMSMSQLSLAVSLPRGAYLRMRSGALAARPFHLLHARRIAATTSVKNVASPKSINTRLRQIRSAWAIRISNDVIMIRLHILR
ncbi:hypothetical protein HFN78_21160 [Rhizobium laguerreae]|uniref:hypothetical protein n=1 Tax=Rhizobium laguerreae TaxID=1076926 RepID=UPI00103B1451|nr:hypothetical protein [Rhizobium laguerreae]MBY3081034.1 hypothetical protein [Rhizobium laguerreae]MBY3114934.1 hypothetical protein [Rhizobium laguerreae]MBY3279816.1 hypothetical protein [Rhizobium laguerreae]MBY3422439.1 hypothetical protein [Rhizobium laguerreae]MBY3473415.1 hypothetical protein [Rhizobium laguerreae]